MSLPVLRANVIATVVASLLTVSVVAQCPGGYGPPPPPVGGGGEWGGPADTTPGGPTTPNAPGPAGPAPASPSGPSSPRPAQPGPVTGGVPSPAAPSAPGPRTGGGRPALGMPARPGAAPRTGPRGAPIGEDLTTWQQWWDFNQDGFLRVRAERSNGKTGSDAFYLGSSRRTTAAKPAAANRPLVVGKVLPSLKRAVEAGPRNVTSASLLALARIGVDHPDFKLFDLLVDRLDDPDQGTRETAAVALGIAGHTDPRALLQLTGLLRNDSLGQKAVGGTVQDRTRAFAAYGLGLLAKRSESVRSKRQVFEALRDVLGDDSIRSRDVRIAAVEAMGLLEIDARQYAGMQLTSDVLKTLDEFFREDRGVGEQHVQAHCPTAIAKLLGREHSQAERFKECFADVLRGRSLEGRKKRRYGHVLSQSCALALGQLVRPNVDGNAKEEPDVRFSKVLLDTWHKHKDAQTRNFAMLALGQIGGKENRDLLLKEFRRASANIEQPWCALALGLMSANKFEETGETDQLVVDTLMKKFRRSKNPQATGALAVSLGLSREDGVGDQVQKRLLGSVGRDTMAAAMCDSLALLGAAGSKEALYSVIRECDRRPRLLQKAAVALGQLGDPLVADMLVRRLTDREPNLAMQQAISNALIDVGGRQQIQPLLSVLDDAGRNAASRASAAKAIGGIVDSRRLPWNTPLRANANYRANVATFTDGASGVLDQR